MTLDDKTRESLAENDPSLMNAITHLEGNITSAYKQAQNVGSDTVLINGNRDLGIQKTTASGSEVANALSGANLNFDNDYDGRATAFTRVSDNSITFGKKVFRKSSNGQQETALHEGMHLLPQTSPWRLSNRRDRDKHQGPFQAAAKRMRRKGK